MATTGKTSNSVMTYEIFKETRRLLYFAMAILTYCAVRGEPIAHDGKYGLFVTYFLFIFSWYIFLLQTYRIEIDKKQKIVRFKKVIKTIEVKFEDIIAIIEHYRWEEIIYKGGSVTIDPFTSNLSSLRANIKTIQSEVKSDNTLLDNPIKNTSITGFFFTFIIGLQLWVLFFS